MGRAHTLFQRLLNVMVLQNYVMIVYVQYLWFTCYQRQQKSFTTHMHICQIISHFDKLTLGSANFRCISMIP